MPFFPDLDFSRRGRPRTTHRQDNRHVIVAAQHFPQFSHLPKEIQFMIWKLAVIEENKGRILCLHKDTNLFRTTKESRSIATMVYSTLIAIVETHCDAMVVKPRMDQCEALDQDLQGRDPEADEPSRTTKSIQSPHNAYSRRCGLRTQGGAGGRQRRRSRRRDDGLGADTGRGTGCGGCAIGRNNRTAHGGREGQSQGGSGGYGDHFELNILVAFDDSSLHVKTLLFLVFPKEKLSLGEGEA
ncbi:hypothetical protein PG994_002685 [Apiospora phragmitis]|uniref:2EXR domain-containing protein n=1 Tax=Apiospora phragmitis TaxID=2905665 RepID=A0ABR1W5Z1_9PEZI